MLRPEEFWQELLPRGSVADKTESWSSAYLARLPEDRGLLLPIRALPDGTHGLASLIINQASFHVQQALCRCLADQLRPFEPDIVVGLPTLGLTVAARVAEELGHQRYVPLGTSRKFWYDEALSAPISSVTTADTRRLYIDPRLLPLLKNRRVVLIDDVLSTGRSIQGGLALLEQIAVQPVAVGALMLQTDRWAAALPKTSPPVVGVFRTPLLRRREGDWIVDGD